MSEHDVKKIVFSSSEGFYGDNGADTSTYGSAKLMNEKILHEIYLADPSWGIKIIRYLTEEDNIYSKKEISVEEMCQTYINAFETLEVGKIEIDVMKIIDKKIVLEPGIPFRGYNVKDLSVKK